MITVPVSDWIFIICMLVGGALLLVTVLVDDIIGGLLDSFDIGFDLGGVSLVPLGLGFISMFGVGGLFGSRVLELGTAQATVVGAIFGGFGFGLVYAIFSLFRRSESEAPFKVADLVGREASVAVAIPAGRFGSVYVRAEGMTREISATASVDLPVGAVVTVTGTAGTGLVVAPREPAAAGAAS